MITQPTPRKSITRQATVARRLASTTRIAQHVLDATVQIFDDREIIHKPGRYGELFFVRSPKFPSRYYPVVCQNGAWRCDAPNASSYIARAQRYAA